MSRIHLEVSTTKLNIQDIYTHTHTMLYYTSEGLKHYTNTIHPLNDVYARTQLQLPVHMIEDTINPRHKLYFFSIREYKIPSQTNFQNCDCSCGYVASFDIEAEYG